MKMKKWLVALMAVLCVGAGALGFAACNDVEDVLNDNGNGLLYQKSAEGNYYIVVGIDPRDAVEDTPMTEIVIPETYLKLPVREVKAKAFYDNDDITSVVISDSVVTIGEKAFAECDNLQHVTVGSVVEAIENEAFYRCEYLVDVYNKSSLIFEYEEYFDFGSIGYNALNIYMDEEAKGTFSTDEEGFAFYKMHEEVYLMAYHGDATELVIPDNVVAIYSKALMHLDTVEKIIIPDSVKKVGWIGWCQNLKEVVFGANVSEMEGVPFSGCPALTTITVSEDNATYSSIAGNLYSKDGKTLVKYISKPTETEFVVPEQVEVLDTWAFYDCTYLTSITLPDGLEEIENYVFTGCTSLTEITLPASVEKIGPHSFEDMTSLTSVVFECVENWYSWDYARYTEITAEDLADGERAAQYLNSTYSELTWKRFEVLDLRELALNREKYINRLVIVEGVITRNYGNGVYLESYDEETNMSYGVCVYYGYGLPSSAIKFLQAGFRVRVVGQFSDTFGYEISGVKYNPDDESDPQSLQKLEENVEVPCREIDASLYANQAYTITFMDGDTQQTATKPFLEWALSTQVTMKNLVVKSVYTTSNGGNAGAMTLTCEVNGQTVIVRTPVLIDDGKVVTEDAYIGQTIDVTAIVDFAFGESEYQLKIFNTSDIVVH